MMQAFDLGKSNRSVFCQSNAFVMRQRILFLFAFLSIRFSVFGQTIGIQEAA
mgnify:CR=1 FL=1